MPGLDPGIHDEVQRTLRVSMDCRVKPGNDKKKCGWHRNSDLSEFRAIHYRKSAAADLGDKPGHDDGMSPNS